GLGEMLGAECRRGGEDREVDVRRQHLVDCIEAGEAALLGDLVARRHRRLVGDHPRELLARTLELVWKQVAKGDDADILARGECVTGSTSSSTTTTDHADPDRI